MEGALAGASGKRVVYAAMIGNALIAVTKFVASGLTGSAAMFSEAIHSAVDTGNQVLLLHGINRSSRPPSPDHPFGYGREIYFWAFVVAVLIFGLGAGLSIYEGVRALNHPEPLEAPWVNYLVLGLAFVIEAGAWWVAFKEFRRTKGDLGFLAALRRSKNPAIFTVLFEDTAAMAGLLIALVGILLGQIFEAPVFDAWASLLIGVMLAGVAALLAYESKGLLIGESADRDVVEGVRAVVGEDRRVVRPLEVLTMHMGPDDILLNLSVQFEGRLTAQEVEDTVCTLEQKIRARFPEIRRVFVEAESLRDHNSRRDQASAA